MNAHTSFKRRVIQSLLRQAPARTGFVLSQREIFSMHAKGRALIESVSPNVRLVDLAAQFDDIYIDHCQQ